MAVVRLIGSGSGERLQLRGGITAHRSFLATVIIVGGIVLARSVVELIAEPVGTQWLMLVALTVVAGWATLRLRAVPVSFSISDTFTIAAALLFGPAAAAVTVAVDALVMSLRVASPKNPLLHVRVLFNATAPALAMWIGAHVFFETAGVGPLAHEPGTIREVVGPLALFALLYFLLNTGLVAVAVAHERGASVTSIWRDHFAPLWLTYIGGASLAGVLVLMTVAQVIDLTALMLVLPLVVVLHVAYRTALDRAHERVEHLTRLASYARALRSTADGVVITGRDQTITLMNSAAEALTGWAESDALGRPLADVFRVTGDTGTVRGDVLTTAEGTLWERRLVNRGGVERPIEEMHASIRGEGGDSSGAIITFRDISERLAIDAERNALLRRERSARAAADAASRMKDEFLTTLSHELRTPATNILGWVRMLKTGRMGVADTNHAVESLERSAKLQAGLIEDLLDVSRIVSGTMRLELTSTNVREVVDRAVGAIRSDAASKEISLRVDVAENVPPLQADPDRLRQALGNLLSNAVKFTDPGGCIDVRVTAEGDHIGIDVVDTGRGIDPEALPFIFERFRQGDSSTTRSHGGLGLGLAIVRHIVELHGGTAMAHSDGSGRGTRVSIRLPVTGAHSSGRTSRSDRSV